MPRENRFTRGNIDPGAESLSPTIREANTALRENGRTGGRPGVSGEMRIKYNQYVRKTARPLPFDQWIEIQTKPIEGEEGSESEPGNRGTRQSLGGKYGSFLGEK